MHVFQLCFCIILSIRYTIYRKKIAYNCRRIVFDSFWRNGMAGDAWREGKNVVVMSTNLLSE